MGNGFMTFISIAMLGPFFSCSDSLSSGLLPETISTSAALHLTAVEVTWSWDSGASSSSASWSSTLICCVIVSEEQCQVKWGLLANKFFVQFWKEATIAALSSAALTVSPNISLSSTAAFIEGCRDRERLLTEVAAKVVLE